MHHVGSLYILVSLSFGQNNSEMFDKYGHTETHYRPAFWKTKKSPTSCKKKHLASEQMGGVRSPAQPNFFMVAPNICSSSARNSIQVIVLKPAILWQLLDFLKIRAPLIWARYYLHLDLLIKIPQTVYLWVLMLFPSLQRSSGITFTECKCPIYHKLFNCHFILSRAPEKYLPKAIHQPTEAGTNTFVWSMTSVIYFKQQMHLYCKSRDLLLQFSRRWSPGTRYCADCCAGTEVSQEPATTISGHKTTSMCQHSITYQKSRLLIFTARPFSRAVSHGATSL